MALDIQRRNDYPNSYPTAPVSTPASAPAAEVTKTDAPAEVELPPERRLAAWVDRAPEATTVSGPSASSTDRSTAPRGIGAPGVSARGSGAGSELLDSLSASRKTGIGASRSDLRLAFGEGTHANRASDAPSGPLQGYGDNGMPAAMGKGDPGGKTENGDEVRIFNTGGNTTKVKGDLNISDAEAARSRAAQAELATKMGSGNPPTAAEHKAHLQKMVNSGASVDAIKAEHGKILSTFYRHPGGVEWSPKLKSDEVDQRFKDQPIAKDGKRLIDCEGYAALSENTLGGLKKGGQPMFDIRCAASDQHVVTGVFPHGGDQRKGFVVDNNSVKSFDASKIADKDWNKTSNPTTKQQRMLINYMTSPENKSHCGTPHEYGPFSDMKSPYKKLEQPKN